MANNVSYHSKLVGVTFDGRQDTLASLKGDESLRFRREPDNEYDKAAVAVDVETAPDKWEPVGYISRDNNSTISAILDKGGNANIELKEVTGGDEKAFGMNVYIEHETNKKTSIPKTAKIEEDLFGNKIYYDDLSHVYQNAMGEVYLSGSKYAASFEPPFQSEVISNAMAKRADLPPEKAAEIREMWELKGLASASLGTSIHAALELYGRFKGLAEELGKDTHLHDHVALNGIVKSFYDLYPRVDNVKYEALVVDHDRKWAGRIDRLEHHDDGIYVTDFKTDVALGKKLDRYWKQLSFYASIIEANGKKVKGLRIYHYVGDGWEVHESEPLEV